MIIIIKIIISGHKSLPPHHPQIHLPTSSTTSQQPTISPIVIVVVVVEVPMLQQSAVAVVVDMLRMTMDQYVLSHIPQLIPVETFSIYI